MSLPCSQTPGIGRTWDIFCRVVDNHGDAGVCWRLATDLASRLIDVRLWIDDARALAWMAPTGRHGVRVLAWPDGDQDISRELDPAPSVVVETFGCGLPSPYLQFMAHARGQAQAPVWINLEYLTAEPYAQRSHCLPSPQSSGPARGMNSWFFYPGFSPGTGGLLRETDLVARQVAFDRMAWLATHGIAPRADERVVSLFCYANPNVPDLLQALAARPTLLLTTPGHASEQVLQALSAAELPARLRIQALPWLTQIDYDHLLWSCDLNFVRGEDSLVRAIWAGRPFVWQIYPQDDGAHEAKLDAFIARKLATVQPAWGEAIRRLSWRWNSLVGSAGSQAGAATDDWNLLNSPQGMSAWTSRCAAWREELIGLPDLTSQLLRFVAGQQSREDAKI
ncbi:MAG: elongation factor P maturation arginine rhamnosyltransferase EarP [Burkholderiaceae bacterium]